MSPPASSSHPTVVLACGLTALALVLIIFLLLWYLWCRKDSMPPASPNPAAAAAGAVSSTPMSHTPPGTPSAAWAELEAGDAKLAHSPSDRPPPPGHPTVLVVQPDESAAVATASGLDPVDPVQPASGEGGPGAAAATLDIEAGRPGPEPGPTIHWDTAQPAPFTCSSTNPAPGPSPPSAASSAAARQQTQRRLAAEAQRAAYLAELEDRAAEQREWHRLAGGMGGMGGLGALGGAYPASSWNLIFLPYAM